MRWVLLALSFTASTATGQEAKKDKYPRVDVAHGYVVDAKWPQRPPELHWAAVSGLAVDARDNVYVLTRTSQPVQVYDPAGKLLRTWGGKDIVRPHQIRLDAEGNVWVTDIDAHTVMQFTPDGKLLKTLGKKDKLARANAQFYSPTDLTFGPNGDLYVSDGYGNARVVQF